MTFYDPDTVRRLSAQLVGQRASASERPTSFVSGARLCLRAQPPRSREEKIAAIRILHPGAVVLMQNGEVKPYGVHLGTACYAYDVPLAILNPNELTAQGVIAALKHPDNARRIINTLTCMHTMAQPDVQIHCAKMIETFSAPEHAEKIAETARCLHQEMTQAYEISVFKETAEVYAENLSEIRALRTRMYINQSASPPEDMMRYEQLLRQNEIFADRLNLLVSHLGAVPEIDADRARQLEENLRQRLADAPDEVLDYLHWAAVPLWASNGISFGAEGLCYGEADGSIHTASVLCDAPIITIAEEVTHLVDNRLCYSRNAQLDECLLDDPSQPKAISCQEQALLDDIVQLCFDKSPLTDPNGAYRIDPALTGQERTQARDHYAAEYLANLVHCVHVTLTPIMREKLGQLLHEHFPDTYPQPAAYDGKNMHTLMEQFLPKSTPYYDGFMKAWQDLNASAQAAEIPKPTQAQFRVR